jgi:carboxyl-terminal processing protease
MLPSSVKKAMFWGLVAALLAAVFVVGIYLGYTNRPAVQKVTDLFNKETAMSPQMDFAPFWTAWNMVESKYVARSGLDHQKMVWGAIEGMVKSLDDPYSVFFPPQETEIFKTSVKGQFSGVGFEIGIRDNTITVITPLKDTPAYRAGIKAGDKILKINGTSTQDMAVDEAVFMIRGERGTAVTLTISREGEKEPRDIKIIRDIIQIPILDTEKNEDGIFVIKLYNFSENSPDAFRNALREMVNSGSSKLILDLRGNAGGYLEASVDIASWFLPAGKTVAIEDFGNHEQNYYRSKGYDIFKNLPFVILVNQGSASAAEILAGALQDHKIATLVGEKTFGKGSVQELVPITDNTSLKITIARWLTPDGKSISEKGLTPDVEIKLTNKDIEAGRDTQMAKALEILKNR